MSPEVEGKKGQGGVKRERVKRGGVGVAGGFQPPLCSLFWLALVLMG